MQRPLLYLKSTISRFCINTHRNAPMLGNRSCNVESISSGWFFSHFEGIFITIGKDTLIYCNVKVFEGENINNFSSFGPFAEPACGVTIGGCDFDSTAIKKEGLPSPFHSAEKQTLFLWLSHPFGFVRCRVLAGVAPKLYS